MTPIGESREKKASKHPLRRITPFRALLILVALLLVWLRYAAAGMDQSSLPETLAHPIAHAGGTLMTYQSGDEDGRPVVFIHGTPGQAGNWDYFIRNPRPGIRGIAVDRPGFGASTPSRGYPSLGEEAKALLPLLESVRGRHPILVGHSLGGPIATQAALDYPDLVGGLIMVAASLDPSVEKIYAVQYLGDLPGVRLLVPRMLRNSNQELIPLREDLERMFTRLGDIACPVTIVHGTQDMLVPFTNVAYMKAAFAPGVVHDTIVLEGENHFLPWTAQESIVEAVEAMAAKSSLEPVPE